MSQNRTISETGLKLIKAFEGYRPVDRELISGQRVVGYGHRLYSEDAVMMNKREAETTLRADLEPFEDMINSEVHAPMSQSQFDALCSFAYNIGPKAFLKSDTLRALNNGRPLDAANGLDIWRKSEIAGKTYVVDALMRRRTAEKALFLRTERDLPAGREDLPPVKDTTITGLSTEDALPVFTQEDANGIVATAPYTAKVMPMRRREDGPAGALQLSELDIIDDSDFSEMDEPIEENLMADTAFESNESAFSADEFEGDIATDSTRPSPIAAAATDIVARLDALIEDADKRFEDPDTEWPESLISTEDTEFGVKNDPKLETKQTQAESILDSSLSDVDANIIELNAPRASTTDLQTMNLAATDDIFGQDMPSKPDPVTVIDELAQDDAMRAESDSASKYIENYTPETSAGVHKEASNLGLWIPVVLGFLLVGSSAGAMVRGSESLLGSWGPIITFTGFVIGLGLILAGIYARLRINSRN